MSTIIPNPLETTPDPDEARRDLARVGAEIARGSGTDPFAAAVRATRMPIVISDPRQTDNPIVFANESFCRLTGYARREIIGRNCRFLQGRETGQAALSGVREAVRRGEPIEADLRNFRKDGTAFWNRMLMAPVHDAQGQLAFFVASQVDVTLEHERLAGLETHNAALLAELNDRLLAQADSEARLLMATQAGRLGIWELDLLTGELTASAIAKEDFGRDPDQPFTYADLLAQIHPDDRDRVEALTSGARRSGAGYDVEYRVLRPDGSTGWLKLRAQAARSPDGTPARVAGVSLDVTARRAAEEKLALSEESLRLATEAAGVGTWDLDFTTQDLTWSDRARTILGIPAFGACSAADFHASLHRDDQEPARAAFARTTDPALRAAYDVEYRTAEPKDGAVRWIAAKGRAVFDAQGQCVRALGTVIDITPRRAEAARQSFLLHLLDRLRSLADPRDIMHEAVHALGRHLGVSRAGFGHVRPDERIAVMQTSYATDDAERTEGVLRLKLLGPALLGQLHAGAIVSVEDIGVLPGAEPGAWDEPETRAFVAVPLLRDGRLKAFLFVGHTTARPWPALDLALIGDVAARTWDAVARAQAEAEVRSANAALERQVAERTAALRASEERMRAVFQTSYQLKGLLTTDGRILDLNATALTAVGQSFSALNGMLFWDSPFFSATPGIGPQIREAVGWAANGRETRRQITLQLPAGPRGYDLALRPIRGADGTAVAVLAEAIDITERRQAEDQLRQAQKMEAVGQLTGGIAHDFNNLLTGIVGSLELLQRRVAEGRTEGLMRYAAAANAAAQRAAALTQRLLAFARRQPLDPKAVDANRLLAGMEDMLRHTLGPSITLHLTLTPGLWAALSDPHQLENALLNLTINARDAMPGGGELFIETANWELDNRYARAHGGEVKPGAYVAVSIRDTGIGMTQDVLAKAFDPFFTTKPLGQGTGLGLSMLYGFIKQSNGHIKVTSQLGQGTTFRLFLPRQDTPAAEPVEVSPAGTSPALAEAGETVLVVEDEVTVRMLVTETLRELGYAVLEAADGPAGLAILQSGVRVDLLVTDVGLPGLNGRQLADAARLLRGGLRVLFMTGYAHNAAIGQGEALEPGMEIISKPFALDGLATRVRHMIEAGTESAST